MQKIVAGGVLKLGENVEHRVCRPAWTSSRVTGYFKSCNHRHGRYLEPNFYVESEGLYKPDNKKVPYLAYVRGGAK